MRGRKRAKFGAGGSHCCFLQLKRGVTSGRAGRANLQCSKHCGHAYSHPCDLPHLGLVRHHRAHCPVLPSSGAAVPRSAWSHCMGLTQHILHLPYMNQEHSPFALPNAIWLHQEPFLLHCHCTFPVSVNTSLPLSIEKLWKADDGKALGGQEEFLDLVVI